MNIVDRFMFVKSFLEVKCFIYTPEKPSLLAIRGRFFLCPFLTLWRYFRRAFFYYNKRKKGGFLMMFQPYYFPQQQRLEHMEQNFYQSQNQGFQRGLIKCRPVTSIEEVRAAMIDLDGSVNVFTDFANGKIYTKQIDLNGMAKLDVYDLQRQPVKEPRYVTTEELESVVTGLMQRIERGCQCEHCKSSTNDDGIGEPHDNGEPDAR